MVCKCLLDSDAADGVDGYDAQVASALDIYDIVCDPCCLYFLKCHGVEENPFMLPSSKRLGDGKFRLPNIWSWFRFGTYYLDLSLVSMIV